MRITFLHPFIAGLRGPLGDEALLARELLLARALKTRGHEVTFITIADVCSPITKILGNIVWTSIPSSWGEGLLDNGLSLVRSTEPDLLIVKGAGTKLGEQSVREMDKPVVLIVGGKFMVWEGTQAQLVATENQSQTRYFRRGLPAQNVIELPKLVDPAFFAAHVDGAVFDFVVVSNFVELKNHRALLPLADRDVRIAYVGDGPLRPRFEDIFAHKAPATCTFFGSLPLEDVAAVMASSRIMLHPSLSEGFPRAVAEAMASGLPVVALADVVGQPLVNGLNGVRVKRSRDLAAESLRLLEQSDLIEQMAIEAKRSAIQFFGEKRFSEVLASFVAAIEATATEPRLDPYRKRVCRRFRAVWYLNRSKFGPGPRSKYRAWRSR